MKNAAHLIFCFFCFTLLINKTNAQGCSDAGFCTLNNFKPHNPTDSTKQYKNQFKIGASSGIADNSILIIGNYIEFNRTLNKYFATDVKLTSLLQSGNNITQFNVADVYLNLNYSLNKKFKFTLGAKIPLTDGNTSKNNLPLPLDYQASLGTYDLIFGIRYGMKKFSFITAIQQPLTQNNNQFVAQNYPANSELSKFQSTRNFIRSGDVLLRASYVLKINPKLKFSPSLLAIYHLTNDKFTDNLGNQVPIIGSQGLTLNTNVYFDYKLTDTKTIQLSLGAPFLTRKARPDGLTRAFVLNLEYSTLF